MTTIKNISGTTPTQNVNQEEKIENNTAEKKLQAWAEYAAIPILKHPELKKAMLYDLQLIHRFAVPLKIGGLIFLVMITVKERLDSKDTIIDEFAIYDLYSEAQENKKSFDSPSTVSVGNNPMTTRSHYRMITYSLNDLIAFVKTNVKNNYC